MGDVSRHAAAIKAAGLVSRLLQAWAPRRPLAALTTGRVSGDMVAAFAAAGIHVVVSNHHPVASGLAEAAARGAVLVLRSPDGRGLAVYTGHGLVEGPAPRVTLRTRGAGAMVYEELPSPLC